MERQLRPQPMTRDEVGLCRKHTELYRGTTPTMENQMKKQMQNEMETGSLQYFVGLRVSGVPDTGPI